MSSKIYIIKDDLKNNLICFLDDTTNLTSDEQMKTSALHQKAVPRCMMGHYM